MLCELGFDSLARENLREALGALSARQVKVINERFLLRTSEKAPRNSRGPWSFPGKGKADTGRVHEETQGIHVRKTRNSPIIIRGKIRRN